MQYKNTEQLQKEASAEINRLIKFNLFANQALISDTLVQKLTYLSEHGSDFERAYGLLHLAKYICEGRVKNKTPFAGFELFETLLQKHPSIQSDDDSENLEVRDVIAAAIEEVAMHAETHQQAVEILLKSYTSMGCKNNIAALSQHLLTGNPPIQKKPAEWLKIFYDLINESLNKSYAEFDFYISHILGCAEEYHVKDLVVKILTNLFMSESWKATHTMHLQNTIVYLYKVKNYTSMKDINDSLNIINDDAFPCSSLRLANN